jgi:DNA-binding CsgD family transcriptional regulator
MQRASRAFERLTAIVSEAAVDRVGLLPGELSAPDTTAAVRRRYSHLPWTRRAEGELRACGVPAQSPPTVPGALDPLTAQQREIVILAGQGLTNVEIADRLFLSPRTVASHLYHSYSKLGIAGSHQLLHLIDAAQADG